MSTSPTNTVPVEWETHAEKTNYRETPRYAETIAYCERLAAASPLIRLMSFGQYNRINQNGPAEMGWRTTTSYLNLNRDYMKADAPETRAWLRLWNSWNPDLFIDCHVTDGADYRYNITYH